ncbi:hypothetical protein Tco_0871236 [Tanacetum coccineum]
MGWVIQSDAVLRSCDAVLDIVVTASRVICDAVSSFYGEILKQYWYRSVNGKGKDTSKEARGSNDEDLQKPFKEVLRSPFTKRIIKFLAPKYLMPTNSRIYDRSTNLDDHVSCFMGAANQGEWQMLVWCRMFQQTLDGPTRGWFDRLPNECIDNWMNLREKFTERLTLRRRCFKDPTEISAFMSNSKCLELARRFSGQVPGTETEMMKRVDDFIKSEEVYRSTELQRGELP